MAVTRKQFINAAADTQNSYWIADTAGEAVAAAVEGDLKYAKDTDTVYSYDGTNWDATGGGTVPASLVTVADSGGYYTATDVEAALVEIATLPGPVQFGSGRDGAMTLDGANYYSALTKTSGGRGRLLRGSPTARRKPLLGSSIVPSRAEPVRLTLRRTATTAQPVLRAAR
jgi:hypothetical protein